MITAKDLAELLDTCRACTSSTYPVGSSKLVDKVRVKIEFMVTGPASMSAYQFLQDVTPAKVLEIMDALELPESAWAEPAENMEFCGEVERK